MGQAEELEPLHRAARNHTRRCTLAILISIALSGVSFLLAQSYFLPYALLLPHQHTDLHPSTHRQDRSIDWSFLHHSRICPHLEPIARGEFTERRNRLASALSDSDERSWAAYISEPSANTLYYLNLTQHNWYLSERPWLAVLSPSRLNRNTAHLSILTPAFEKSRSQHLPFPLTADERAEVDWVTWEEADDRYVVLLDHLARLRNGSTAAWSLEIEENVRTFVRDGLAVAAQARGEDAPKVGLARLGIRELRMRKSDAERTIQHCVAKITVEALRAVRKHLWIGMTEKEGEALITNALHAGGLSDVEVITLFGENAALPHASASANRRLKEGDFALFDVGGSLFGYISDFTRTMLPDPPLSRFSRAPAPRRWPSERAEKIWRTVHRAQEAALSALVTDNESSVVHAAEVDRAARNVIETAGWGQYFTHRLGHGIGLEVHEHPYLNGGNTEQALLPGETFSNEPGVYIERAAADPDGAGIGVRLEDMVRKTERGWELVSGEPLATSPWEP